MPPYKKSQVEQIRELQERIAPEGCLPPQDIPAEQSVMGALLVNKDSWRIVVGLLGYRSEDNSPFYRDAHTWIYMAACELDRRNEVIDLLTVTNELRSVNRLDDVGGPSYLVSLTTKIVTTAHVEAHTKLIIEKHVARQTIAEFEHAKLKLYTGSDDTFDVLNEADAKILELRNNGVLSNGPITLREAGVKAMEAINTRAANAPENGGCYGIATGIAALDKVTDGFEPGQLIVVAARPGMGKSAFASTVALNIAERGVGVGYFSLEMSITSVLIRMVAKLAKANSRHVKKKEHSEAEQERINQAWDRVHALTNLHIDDNASLSPLQFRTTAIDLARRKGVKFFVIDYLQLMDPGVTKSTRDLEIGFITRTLKRTALELGVTIMLLSQLNRGVETRQDKRPTLADLRESGNIEQDSDIVIFPFDNAPDQPQAEAVLKWSMDAIGKAYQLLIRKFRDGEGHTDIDVIFTKEFSLFEDAIY